MSVPFNLLDTVPTLRMRTRGPVQLFGLLLKVMATRATNRFHEPRLDQVMPIFEFCILPFP